MISSTGTTCMPPAGWTALSGPGWRRNRVWVCPDSDRKMNTTYWYSAVAEPYIYWISYGANIIGQWTAQGWEPLNWAAWYSGPKTTKGKWEFGSTGYCIVAEAPDALASNPDEMRYEGGLGQHWHTGRNNMLLHDGRVIDVALPSNYTAREAVRTRKF